MKASKELVQHISTTFWDRSNKEIAQCLEDFKGNPLRDEETLLEVKHTIERVNAKYPNGWYCEAFEEVREDSEKEYKKISKSKWEYYGWFSFEDDGFLFIGFNDDDDLDLSNVTLIPKSEYLAITRGVEEQPKPARDYTGVRFRHKNGDVKETGVIIVLNEKVYLVEYPDQISAIWHKKAVETQFADGTWIEIPQDSNESAVIHAEKPSDIEERVKALESKCEDIVKETSLHIEAINKIVTDLNSKVYGYCDSSLPTKRNLSIDTPTIDWKKVECLSYKDVIEAIQNNWGLKLGDALEIYIKNKLKM